MPTDPGFRNVYPTTTKKPPVTAANAFEARVANMRPAPPPSSLAGNAFQDQFDAINAFLQNAAGSRNFGPQGQNTSGSSRGGGGGGGGGSPLSAAKANQYANELYSFNPASYNQMHADVANQRNQANAYNPDFGAMQQEYLQRNAAIDQQRNADIQQRMAGVGQLGNQLATQQGTALSGALRDLGNQGAPMQGLVDRTNQLGLNQAAALTNQGAFMGSLNAAGANQSADAARASGLISQGGQATLANNRGQLMNQLASQDTQIGLQQAQAQQAMEQQRREFLLKYGVV
jgi:hypothetical protein